MCSYLLLSVAFVHVAKPLTRFWFRLYLCAYCNCCDLLTQLPIFISQLRFSSHSVALWEKAYFCQCSESFLWFLVNLKQKLKHFISANYSKNSHKIFFGLSEFGFEIIYTETWNQVLVQQGFVTYVKKNIGAVFWDQY